MTRDRAEDEPRPETAARVACLYLPLFPLAARLRSEPALEGEAVVVCEGNGSAARVAAAARPARRCGVRRGMTLATARSMLPELIARGRDSVCEQAAHEALLEVGWSLSPRVEDAGEDSLFVDVAGMGLLFPGPDGEHEMGHVVTRTATALGLRLRVGVAACKLAARIAAAMPDSPTVVPAGDEMSFLAPLPLSRLGLDERLAETLQRWGLATIGDLARLPADRIRSRLGTTGEAAHRAARGIDPRPLTPLTPPPVLREGMELEWPVVNLEPLLYAIRGVLERLSDRLDYQQLACSVLEIELSLEPDGYDSHAIRLPAPTREVDTLVALVRLEMESHSPPAPVSALSCAAHPALPRRAQLTLFGPAELHPDRLATTLARIASRIGANRVGSPRTVDVHLPESCHMVAFDPPPPPKLRRDPAQGRGLLAVRVLRPPVPLEVIVEEGPGSGVSVREVEARYGAGQSEVPGLSRLRLVSVRSETGAAVNLQGLVRVAAGPWRVEEGWWSDQPARRDYWDVELSDGGLYRIYRDPTTADWFADGMYD